MPDLHIEGNYSRLGYDVEVDDYRWGVALTHAGLDETNQADYQVHLNPYNVNYTRIKTYDLRLRPAPSQWKEFGVKLQEGALNSVIELPIDRIGIRGVLAERLLYDRDLRVQTKGPDFLKIDSFGFSMLLAYAAAQAKYLQDNPETAATNPNKTEFINPLALSGGAVAVGGIALAVAGFVRTVSDFSPPVIDVSGSDLGMIFGGLGISTGGAGVGLFARAHQAAQLPINVAGRAYMDRCIADGVGDAHRNPWSDVALYNEPPQKRPGV